MQDAKNISYWLAALYLPGIGPVKIYRWLAHFGNMKSIFTASLQEWQAVGLSAKEIHALQNPDWDAVHRDLAWSENTGCCLLTRECSDYPLLLRELNDAPLVLYVRGKVECLQKPQVAIVGTRNPTAGGRELAEQFAYYLSKSGLVVTSGLALGVDAASHEGALSAKGYTIAVMGTGHHHVYPASHTALYEKIISAGAVVSEFPPDTLAMAHHFPRRNRIISGLSLGVLVVEAALRSGSLITARFAAEQGREVFAIPGSIHNPLARGCHQLIQQGAKLIEKASDILEELGALRQALLPEVTEKTPVSMPVLDQKMSHLLQAVGYEATALDTIMIRSGLTAAEVSSMLLSLELRSYVQIVPGGYVRSAP
ncbi:MAG: DNA-processing protein DprA [Gammaproteobacteria bacterium]|nr:DNA-processing protein DprA [Gammaproteobacteria bacterium]